MTSSSEDDEKQINERAEALVQDTIRSIGEHSQGDGDVLRAGLGVLIGRTAKIEAVVERLAEVMREHAGTVLMLSQMVLQHRAQLEALLNDELKASKYTRSH